ncbi:unnamed protein product, partial [marine sediment metagenome]
MGNLGRDGKEISIKYKLDESWIAGIIGPHEIKIGGNTILVTLRVDDIYKVVSIKKPSRNEKTIPEMTEEEKIIAEKYMIDTLKNGIEIKNPPSSLKWIKGYYLRLENNAYYLYIRENNKIIEKVRWEDYTNIQRQFGIIGREKINIDNSIKIINNQENGVMDGCFSSFSGENISYGLIDELISNMSIEGLQKLIMYITGYKSKIDMYKINKKGVGSEYAINNYDTEAFHALLQLSLIFPGAFKLVSVSGFRVVNGPLMWYIRDYIKLFGEKKLKERITERKWKSPHDSLGRILWEHQNDTVKRMIEKNEKRVKGHLIWI